MLYKVRFKKKTYFNGMKYMRGKGAIEETPDGGYFEIFGTTKNNIQLIPEGGTMRDRFSIKKDEIEILERKKEEP